VVRTRDWDPAGFGGRWLIPPPAVVPARFRSRALLRTKEAALSAASVYERLRLGHGAQWLKIEPSPILSGLYDGLMA
jgi:hypothetical protein